MRERERDIQRPSEWDGEELVDGRAGGTENVIDAEAASPSTGRTIGGMIVILALVVLLAMPLVWGSIATAAKGSMDAPFSDALLAIYASLVAVLVVGTAFFAYSIAREGLR